MAMQPKAWMIAFLFIQSGYHILWKMSMHHARGGGGSKENQHFLDSQETQLWQLMWLGKLVTLG